MAEGGVESKEYQEFVAVSPADAADRIPGNDCCLMSQSGSKNMDDSGFFSVQVIASALRVWQLDLIPYLSKNATSDAARKNPT